MTRINTRLMLVMALSLASVAQVRITLPKQHYKTEEEIRPKLENHGDSLVMVCVEAGQWSPNGTGIDSTPSPFWVQRKGNDGTWRTLLLGPDIGSNRQPLELEGHKSLEFPLRLSIGGTMRLGTKFRLVGRNWTAGFRLKTEKG